MFATAAIPKTSAAGKANGRSAGFLDAVGKKNKGIRNISYIENDIG